MQPPYPAAIPVEILQIRSAAFTGCQKDQFVDAIAVKVRRTASQKAIAVPDSWRTGDALIRIRPREGGPGVAGRAMTLTDGNQLAHTTMRRSLVAQCIGAQLKTVVAGDDVSQTPARFEPAARRIHRPDIGARFVVEHNLTSTIRIRHPPDEVFARRGRLNVGKT